jgi:maleylacetoacetate isomerase
VKLYSYYRSSAAYRVRIALNLKGLSYQHHGVDLLNAEEQGVEYEALNPQKLVPVFEDNGQVYFQSMAILEYLEEAYPQSPILPGEKADRARVRAMANIIACDIHPLNNLRTLKYLTGELGVDEANKLDWYRHWVSLGFEAVEAYLQNCSSSQYCFGDEPGMADILLIPQVYNAHRFEVDMNPFPLINSINTHCLSLQAFIDASPENQPDAK